MVPRMRMRIKPFGSLFLPLEAALKIMSSLERSERFPRALGVLDVTLALDHAPIIFFSKDKFENKKSAEELMKKIKLLQENPLIAGRANTICKLKDEQETWMENGEDRAKHFQEYF
ncbi:hypothetical protein V6N11_028685 [Hibiscus sabdariffa]|uniref:Uncharacterized protein n=1 Tax=Hibiscus sabdariffa TaxID=183260 RepID=A0ABR2PR09_9ROSI